MYGTTSLLPLRGHSKQVGSRTACLPSSPAASICLPVHACYRGRSGSAQIYKVFPKEEEHTASCLGTAVLRVAERNPSPETLLPSSPGAGLRSSDCKTYRIASSDTTLGPHNTPSRLSLTSSLSLAPFLVSLYLSLCSFFCLILHTSLLTFSLRKKKKHTLRVLTAFCHTVKWDLLYIHER